MSPKEKIAKLEGLLARVKERTEVARPSGAVAIAAAPVSTRSPAREPVAVKPAQPAAPPRPAPSPLSPQPPVVALAAVPESAPPETVVTTSTWSEPPVELDADLDADISYGEVSIEGDAEVSIEGDAEVSIEGDAEVSLGVAGDAEVSIEGDAEISIDGDAEVSIDGDADEEVEMEVSAEVVELEVDVDETGASMPAESGAQPVAEHVDDGAVAELEEIHEELVDTTSSHPGPPANEVEESAPSSSPRPIAPADTSYGEERAHRHTPPPESGKQVAAASVKPDPRLSSLPPSEGHTLVGGWREPGMAIPRDAAPEPSRTPAGRVPPPPPPPPAPEPVAARSLPRPARTAEPSSRIAPEVTKVELPTHASVAKVEGEAPSFAPSTFGELLEASLGL